MTSPMNEINNSNEFIATDNSHEELTAAAALAELVEGATAANQQDCMDEDVASQCDDGDAFVFPQRFTKSGRQRAVPFPLKVGHSFCMCCGYLSGLSAPSPVMRSLTSRRRYGVFPCPLTKSSRHSSPCENSQWCSVFCSHGLFFLDLTDSDSFLKSLFS